MIEKYLYLTDVHYGARPINRKDDYNKSILSKLEYALKLARKNDAIVLCGGDIFDTNKTKIIDMIPLAKLFMQYKDVKIYSLRGNPTHDGLEETSPFTLFWMAGLIQNSSSFIDFEMTRVHFCNHHTDLKAHNDHIDPSKFNMIMTHTILVKDPVIYDHILIKNFMTKAHMVFIADYHPYQGMMKRESDGVVFIAPGALARRKKTMHDIDRIPKVVFIIIEDGKLKGIKEIDIPCASDVWEEGSELDTIEETWHNKEVLESVEKMKLAVDSSEVFMSLEDSLKKFAKILEVDTKVIDRALKLFNQ